MVKFSVYLNRRVFVMKCRNRTRTQGGILVRFTIICLYLHYNDLHCTKIYHISIFDLIKILMHGIIISANSNNHFKYAANSFSPQIFPYNQLRLTMIQSHQNRRLIFDLDLVMFHLIFDLVKYLHLFYSLFLELEERDLTRTLRYDFFLSCNQIRVLVWSLWTQ